MLEVSNLLLSMYDEAQHAPLGEFIDNSFRRIQKLLKFDSAGIVSFGIARSGDLEFKGGYAFQISAEEKLKARLDLNLQERFVPGQGLVGSDPILTKAFRFKKQCHFMNLEAVTDKRLVEYGKRTASSNTLAIVTDEPHSAGYSCVSLWRSGRRDVYFDQHAMLGNILLPHLLTGLGINRKLLSAHSPAEVAFAAPIICSLNGFINFIDDDVSHFLQAQFANWLPPFLPKVVLDTLRANSAMRYSCDSFAAEGRLSGNLLIVSIVKTRTPAVLTKTELAVARLLAADISYKEIASQLHTSPATVRNQAHSIYQKLKVAKKSAVGAALKMQQ